MTETSVPNVASLLDFRGRAVIVTGSGSGLGQGIAWRFAQAGAGVVVHYRASAAGAHDLVERIGAEGGHAVALQADLSQPGRAAKLVEAAVGRFGRIDVLVNNAGTQPLTELLTMTADQWDTMLDANLRSVFLMTQAAAGVMRQQGEGGAIINITSIEAHNPAPRHSHYCASKAGLEMFTRAAAAELGRDGIRVNAVAPGLIWRPGLEEDWPDGVARYRRAAPLGRLGLPADVADACLFLASPAARWITGASLTVDGGILTHQVY